MTQPVEPMQGEKPALWAYEQKLSTEPDSAFVPYGRMHEYEEPVQAIAEMNKIADGIVSYRAVKYTRVPDPAQAELQRITGLLMAFVEAEEAVELAEADEDDSEYRGNRIGSLGSAVHKSLNEIRAEGKRALEAEAARLQPEVSR